MNRGRPKSANWGDGPSWAQDTQKSWSQSNFSGGFNDYDGGYSNNSGGGYGAYGGQSAAEYKMYENRMHELLTVQKQKQIAQKQGARNDYSSRNDYGTIPSLMDLDLGFQGQRQNMGYGGASGYNSNQRSLGNQREPQNRGGIGRGRGLISQALNNSGSGAKSMSYGRGSSKPSLLGPGNPSNQRSQVGGYGGNQRSQNAGFGGGYNYNSNYDNSWDYGDYSAGGYSKYYDSGYDYYNNYDGYGSYDDYYCDYSGYGNYNRYQGYGSRGYGYGNQSTGRGRGKSADPKKNRRGNQSSHPSHSKPGRIEFPDLPLKKMQQGEILLALQSVKQDVKNKAKKGSISWKDLDAILHEYKLHGSTLFLRQPETLTYKCELYTGNFFMGAGECETKEGNRLEARIKAYDDAIEKLKNKTPGECLDFGCYLGLRQIKEREVDQVISPGICKVSNVGNIMTMRTDLTPKPLTDMVLLKPAKPEHQSVPEMLKSSGAFSKFFLEYYFFKNRKGDSKAAVSCSLYVDKKLISKCTGPNNFTAKNKASNECLEKLSKKCYTIETKRFELSVIEQNVDSSLADLILNKPKYLKNPNREISKRLQVQLSGAQKDENGIPQLIVVTRADICPHEDRSNDTPKLVVEEEDKKEEKKAETKKDRRKKKAKSAAKFEKKDTKAEEESKSADEQKDKSSDEQEESPEKETPQPKLDSTSLKRVELILVKYIESDLIDNIVFSNEFASSELAQIKEICIEYKLRPEMQRLSGSDSISVLFVRKMLDARQVVERILSFGGETARYKVISPPELPQSGEGDNLTMKDSDDEEEQ